MHWLASLLDRAQTLMEQGGGVMPYILVFSLLMWILIIERYWYLLAIYPKQLARIHAEWEAHTIQSTRVAHRLRTRKIAALVEASRRALPIIRTLIQVLPLMGLLGTVSGMIHTFEVITVFGGTNRRGIAAGISEALVATLTGLVTALSGLYFSVNLESRVRHIPAEAEDRLSIEEE
jgi:biopolymer transport protein ExbB